MVGIRILEEVTFLGALGWREAGTFGEKPILMEAALERKGLGSWWQYYMVSESYMLIWRKKCSWGS